MKKIALWSWLLMKRQLKSLFFLLILILIPVISFVGSRTEALSKEQETKVALFARDDDEIAGETIEALLTMDSSYTFYLCESEEELLSHVRNKEAECGYIFDENLSEKIEKEKYKKNITVVQNSNSMLTNIINETVFSAFFKQFTKKTAMDYVANNEKFAAMHPEGFVQLEGAFEQYTKGDAVFKVSFEMLGDGESLTETTVIETKAVGFPLRNIMAVLIMAGAMLGILNWLNDREKGVFAPMKREFILASRPLYILIPALLLGISTIVSLAACGESVSVLRELLGMMLYILLLTVLGVVCCLVIKKSFTIISAMPVMIIGSLLVCPVFIDLVLYIPVLKWVRYLFVPYYYMMLF